MSTIRSLFCCSFFIKIKLLIINNKSQRLKFLFIALNIFIVFMILWQFSVFWSILPICPLEAARAHIEALARHDQIFSQVVAFSFLQFFSLVFQFLLKWRGTLLFTTFPKNCRRLRKCKKDEKQNYNNL